MRYKFTISHVPGTSLKVADALSRAPVSTAMPTDVLFEQETAAYVDSVVKNLPDKQVQRIKRHQEEDEEYQEAILHTLSGWPSRQSLCGVMKHYLNIATELSVQRRNSHERQQTGNSISSQTRDAG